jgi:hypothetical protein
VGEAKRSYRTAHSLFSGVYGDKVPAFFRHACFSPVVCLVAGDEHFTIVNVVHSMARLVESKEDFDGAVLFYAQSYRLARSLFGPSHPFTVACADSYCSVLVALGQQEQALTVKERLQEDQAFAGDSMDPSFSRSLDDAPTPAKPDRNRIGPAGPLKTVGVQMVDEIALINLDFEKIIQNGEFARGCLSADHVASQSEGFNRAIFGDRRNRVPGFTGAPMDASKKDTGKAATDKKVVPQNQPAGCCIIN